MSAERPPALPTPARARLPILGLLPTATRVAILVTLLLSLGTIAFELLVASPNQTLVFVLAAVSILGLAWVICLATERLGAIAGPPFGGVLNATFGNLPQLNTAFFAIQAVLTEGVKASLPDSISRNP